MTSRPDVEQQFEAWAQVAARLRHRPRNEKVEILEGLGLSESYWRDVNEAWAKSLNEDIAAGRMERPFRYAQICKAELARRDDPVAQPDFRDSLTPPAHPRVPLSRQPETQPGHFTAVAEDEEPTLSKEASPTYDASDDAPRPDDFRRELVPVERPLAAPSPHQIHTVEGGEGSADLVEAARQANAAALWPVEKWATLCARLDDFPDDADRIWSEVGVTNPRARPHVRAHWKRKLSKEPATRARFKALLAERRGAPRD